jgi:hypothetical protein
MTGRAEREEELRLLALIAQGLGAEGLEDYQVPAARWREQMAEPEESRDPERRLRLLMLPDGDVEEVGDGR